MLNIIRNVFIFIGNSFATIKVGFMEGYHKGLHREALASQERCDEPLHNHHDGCPDCDDSPSLCDA
jgi:hypothetical protein